MAGLLRAQASRIKEMLAAFTPPHNPRSAAGRATEAVVALNAQIGGFDVAGLPALIARLHALEAAYDAAIIADWGEPTRSSLEHMKADFMDHPARDALMSSTA